jgi:O-methyltransferase involved in polyketide biosynthesis
MPDVIELRRRLYPERHDCTLIGSSVTALHWLDEIPADRPVLVVAVGLVQYLSEKEAIALFSRITEKFPGGEFIFDAYSRLATRLVSLLPAARKANVSLPWGISDPRKLEKQVPGLKLVTEVSFLFMPEFVERLSQSQSWAQRVMYRIMGHITFLRRSILHLRYRF